MLSVDPRGESLLWNIPLWPLLLLYGRIDHSRNGLHHKIDIPDSWSGRCVLLVIFPGTGKALQSHSHVVSLLCGISAPNCEMIGSDSVGGW